MYVLDFLLFPSRNRNDPREFTLSAGFLSICSTPGRRQAAPVAPGLPSSRGEQVEWGLQPQARAASHMHLHPRRSSRCTRSPRPPLGAQPRRLPGCPGPSPPGSTGRAQASTFLPAAEPPCSRRPGPCNWIFPLRATRTPAGSPPGLRLPPPPRPARSRHLIPHRPPALATGPPFAPVIPQLGCCTVAARSPQGPPGNPDARLSPPTVDFRGQGASWRRVPPAPTWL